MTEDKPKSRIDRILGRRRGTLHVPGSHEPRPAPKPVPETTRLWRPRSVLL
jgi:hypothetical protein